MSDAVYPNRVPRGIHPLGRLALLATWRRAATCGAATNAAPREAIELLEEERFEPVTGLRESFWFLPTWGAAHDFYRSEDGRVLAMLSKFAFGRTVSFFTQFEDGFIVMMGTHPRPLGIDAGAVDMKSFHYCPASTDLRESYAYFLGMIAHHESQGRMPVSFRSCSTSDALAVQREYWLRGPAQVDRSKALTVPFVLFLCHFFWWLLLF